MLRQESITAVSHAPTAPATLDCELLAGTESLIEEIHQRLLDGQSLNNRTLTEIADRAYDGSRARGTYTARDAYDATETAVNRVLETKASELMTMSVSDALSQTLDLSPSGCPGNQTAHASKYSFSNSQRTSGSFIDCQYPT